jgi:hypothetical protein
LIAEYWLSNNREVTREGEAVMTTLVSEMPISRPQQPRQDCETAPNAMSRIMMPRVEPSESLAAKLLVTPNGAEEANGSTDLLIQGLVDRLPKANGVWSLDERAKWLRTAASIFDLVYKADAGEQREIGVAFAKQDIGRTA